MHKTDMDVQGAGATARLAAVHIMVCMSAPCMMHAVVTVTHSTPWAEFSGVEAAGCNTQDPSKSVLLLCNSQCNTLQAQCRTVGWRPDPMLRTNASSLLQGVPNAVERSTWRHHLAALKKHGGITLHHSKKTWRHHLAALKIKHGGITLQHSRERLQSQIALCNMLHEPNATLLAGCQSPKHHLATLNLRKQCNTNL
jgi:hypothetical protein